jgi:hypothetical protein
MPASGPSGLRHDNVPPPCPPDAVSPDSIIKALYESISFAPGAQPNFDRLKTLFHPLGRLVTPKSEKDDQVPVLDVDTFCTRSREFVVITGLERLGFLERELHRDFLTFANICHAWSTYESKHTAQDATPIQRGINSIQLVRDAGRWWVVTVMWDVEHVKHPIPKQYLT